jgi:ubiquinone/menaquinone biosynthesis C-methylase UbiE
MQQDLTRATYDAVYAALPESPTLRRLWHEHVEGLDFPEEFGHVSFVTLSQLRRMATELRLGLGDTLVDLGCGMGGPALWVARETGARLHGVDFSPVAVEKASARAVELGLAGQAQFVVGSFADTGLEPGSADGAMSEDAIDYAPDKRAAIVEAARILRPGGRLTLTTFEVDPDRVASLPDSRVDPVGDYRPLLTEGGLSVEVYEEVPGWPEPMTTAYSAALEAREVLEQELGEVAAQAMFFEMSRTLEQRLFRRRVMIAATRQ